MKPRAFARWRTLSAVLALLFVASALTQSAPRRGNNERNTAASVTAVGIGAPQAWAGAAAPSARRSKSIAGSTVATDECYQAGAIRSMCFAVHNASSDVEWLDAVELIFPDFPGLGPWGVSCLVQDSTDSSGGAVSFSCGNSAPNRLAFLDNDADSIGEVSSGSSWGFCVDVSVPPGYDGPRILNWNLSGDEGGTPPPHEVAGQFSIEQCRPLMVFPPIVDVDGCAGLSRSLTFDVWNNTGTMRTIDLDYSVPSGNGALFGPTSIPMPAGVIAPIVTELEADVCLAPGTPITALLEASAGIDVGISQITQTVSAFAGWETRAVSPVAAMDSVVAWAVIDGGLWSVGGYAANGATQRYDPVADTWSTHAPEPAPRIDYPMDGCYGLGPDDDEVIVLFPDTITSATALHRYNITDDAWDTPPIPVGFPGARWSQDIVSLYGITGENLCYISGGATSSGGGDVNNLWSYHPDTNVTIYLGNFTHHPAGFDFHASWFVPWVGTGGAICVGGGIDKSSGVIMDTQCFDRAAAQFNPPNADLGPLPKPWWGMADGWNMHQGRYQIWIANGVAQDGTLLPAAAYQDETMGGFEYGPDPPVARYRLEGDGWEGHFHVMQGSSGGFNATTSTLAVQQCPACGLIFANGFE